MEHMIHIEPLHWQQFALTTLALAPQDSAFASGLHPGFHASMLFLRFLVANAALLMHLNLRRIISQHNALKC
jgi:hypothetical protein